MKRELNPRLLIPVLLVGVLVLAFVGYRVWSAPSIAVPPPDSVANAASTQGGAVRGSGLQAGGGPPEEALRKRDEYNRQNPEAKGSR